MGDRASFGGVSSLRAKFEFGQHAMTPDGRGRTEDTTGNGDLARPMSKVRTSFVPVEPTTPKTNGASENSGGGAVQAPGSYKEILRSWK